MPAKVDNMGQYRPPARWYRSLLAEVDRFREMFDIERAPEVFVDRILTRIAVTPYLGYSRSEADA